MRPAGVAFALLAVACSTRGPESAGGATGTAGAKMIVAAMRAAEVVRAPWRCARLRSDTTPPATPDVFDAGGRRWTVDGPTLTVEPAGDGVRLGLVADARGDSDAAVAALTRLGTPFTEARVDVVVAVGGMGASEDELVHTLEPLGRGGWPVIAIPGDRESWPALRRAVARLRGRGAPVVDGAQVRFIEAGGVVMATLPGMPFRERLAAGDDGCRHDEADVGAVLAALAARSPDGKAGRRPRVLLSPRAPRTAGDGSDLAQGGVHAGDVGLARALAEVAVDLVVHGQVAERPLVPGRAPRGPVVLAAGAVDPAPRFDDRGMRLPAQAAVVAVDRRGGIAWRAVPVVP
jgi:hypothetical protein